MFGPQGRGFEVMADLAQEESAGAEAAMSRTAKADELHSGPAGKAESGVQRAKIRALARGLDVLEALANYPQGVALSELARELGLSKGALYRVLITLSDRDYVRQDQATSKYALGGKLTYFGRMAERATDLRVLASSALWFLQEKTAETVHLAVPVSDGMTYHDKVESAHSVQVAARVGEHVGFHCSSLGKAFLAFLVTTEIDRRLASITFERRTDRTIMDPEAFRAELAKVRKRGFAVDNVENDEGVRCVGAAIFDSSRKPIACLSVSAPVQRFSMADAVAAGELCVQSADRVSRLLAGPTIAEMRAEVGSIESPVNSAP